MREELTPDLAVEGEKELTLANSATGIAVHGSLADVSHRGFGWREEQEQRPNFPDFFAKNMRSHRGSNSGFLDSEWLDQNQTS